MFFIIIFFFGAEVGAAESRGLIIPAWLSLFIFLDLIVV